MGDSPASYIYMVTSLSHRLLHQVRLPTTHTFRCNPFPNLARMQDFVFEGESWSTVQHLIEKCLIFHMTKEECIEALSKHAKIKPVITVTVWNELEKENREFFEAYAKSHNKNHATEAEAEVEASTMIQKLLLDHDHTKNSDKD